MDWAHHGVLKRPDVASLTMKLEMSEAAAARAGLRQNFRVIRRLIQDDPLLNYSTHGHTDAA